MFSFLTYGCCKEYLIFSPLNCFCSFDKYQSILNIGAYFGALSFVTLIYLFILLPISCCPDFCSYIIQLKILQSYSVALHLCSFSVLCWLFLVLPPTFFWPAPVAYGGSQARGLIGAAAAGLPHSHSNTRSKTLGNTRSLTH